jgi:predicted deacylase
LGRDGVLRVLHALGMLKIAPRKKGPHSALIAKTTWVRAVNSGILRLDAQLGGAVTARQQLGLVADAFGEDAAPVLAPEDGIVIGHTNNPLVQQGEAVLHLATMAPEGAAAGLPEIEVDSR